MVRDYEPTVVILIARKAPRIAQAFELEFGSSILVISDLAIAFAARQLEGARVAIVDDVVNVGSTLLRAKRLAIEAGATGVEMFVVADRNSDQRMQELGEVHVADSTPLDQSSREALSAEIPGRIQSLCRPYDLDFPLLQCGVPARTDEFSRLLNRMSSKYGDENVYDLTTPLGMEAGVRRFTIDFSKEGLAPTKVRIYVNTVSGECVLAPIRLQSPLPSAPPAQGWRRAFWEAMGVGPSFKPEARGRLRLFLDSLDFGLSFAGDNADVFRLDSDCPLILEDAELAFGPDVEFAARKVLRNWLFWVGTASPEKSVGISSESPFLGVARDSGLIADVSARISGDPDELSVFVAFFNTLADWAGADQPSAYRLPGPFRPHEVAADPYLRLRVGPTFADLVAIVDELVPGLSGVDTMSMVSRLLDRFVDDGGVVPTTASYGEQLFRIYRKGEKDPRERVDLRTCRAWQETGKALSLTRVSKLAAIIAFSEEPGASDVAVATDTRGNVFCHADSVLHDRAEISHRLLRAGQLERAS